MLFLTKLEIGNWKLEITYDYRMESTLKHHLIKTNNLCEPQYEIYPHSTTTAYLAISYPPAMISKLMLSATRYFLQIKNLLILQE